VVHALAELVRAGERVLYVRGCIALGHDERRAERHPERQLVARAPRCGRLGDCLDELQRARCMVRGLAMAMVTQGIVRRLSPILHRSLEVPALLEMQGELSGDLDGVSTVRPFETCPDAEVQPDPMPDRDARVEHLAIEGVNERIAPRDRAVGPFRRADGAEELSSMSQGG